MSKHSLKHRVETANEPFWVFGTRCDVPKPFKIKWSRTVIKTTEHWHSLCCSLQRSRRTCTVIILMSIIVPSPTLNQGVVINQLFDQGSTPDGIHAHSHSWSLWFHALYTTYATIPSPFFPLFLIIRSAVVQIIDGLFKAEDDNEASLDSIVPFYRPLWVSRSPLYSFICLWSAPGPP